MNVSNDAARALLGLRGNNTPPPQSPPSISNTFDIPGI